MQKSSESFPKFIQDRKDLKYFYFGGKGGVGKTAVAGAAAYYLAETLRKKVLISSTNPVPGNRRSPRSWLEMVSTRGSV